MTLEEFTQEIAGQFEERLILESDTDFRNNDYFDSLIGMSILVMIKDEFNYDMDVQSFLRCKTPRELFNKISGNNN
ncbi:MAG: acyl carrier protein [Syntrophomonas sp.]